MNILVPMVQRNNLSTIIKNETFCLVLIFFRGFFIKSEIKINKRGLTMNIRIYRKIYKRADAKVSALNYTYKSALHTQSTFFLGALPHTPFYL